MVDAAVRLIRANPAAAAAIAVAAGGVAAILGAWFFQYGLGLAPCPLCLEQRIPYYAAIPLALIVAAAARKGAPRAILAAGLGAIAIAMLTGAGIAVYHAGIEWHWWTGPRDCSGPLAPLGQVKDLLRELETINLVRCDEAPWRFLGFSLAGWNVLISLALAAVAAWGGMMAMRRADAGGGGRQAQSRGQFR